MDLGKNFDFSFIRNLQQIRKILKLKLKYSRLTSKEFLPFLVLQKLMEFGLCRTLVKICQKLLIVVKNSFKSI